MTGRSSWFAAALLLAGCSNDTFFAAQPWDDDRAAIVYAIGNDGRPADDRPRTYSGARIELTHDGSLPATFHVETFDASFFDCEARYEAVGEPLPDPIEAFVSGPLEVGGSTEIVLSPRTQSRPVPLHLAAPCGIQRPTLCALSETHSSLLALPGVDVYAVDRIDTKRLVYGGSPDAIGERSEDGTLTPFGFVPNSPIVDVLVDDPDRIYAMSRRGRLYELDGQGVVRQEIDLDVREARLSQDAAGRLFIVGETGAFLVARGATTAIALDEFPDGTTAHAFVAGIRFAVARNTIHSNATGWWVPETNNSQIDPATKIIGDGTRILAVSPHALLERQSDGSWTPVANPFSSLAIVGGAADGRGRIVLFGESGALALLDSDSIEACRIDAGVTANWWDAVFSADGRHAYVVGSNTAGDTPPGFAEITLPPVD